MAKAALKQSKPNAANEFADLIEATIRNNQK